MQSPRLHLYRAERLSHERVGQSITSIRAHGPEQRRFCACHLALYGLYPKVLQLTCSSRCSSSVRVRWKMTLTGEVESLVARCRHAAAHDMRV